MNGVSSLLISDYIVNKYNGKFTPFHLIKMVFISHGRVLASLKKPLIRDRIEAWKHGPVIPLLYHELKLWGDAPVQNLHYCGTKPDNENRHRFFESILSEEECSIINGVVDDYGDWSFWDLRRLCHEPGSPWDIHYDGKLGTELPDSTIQEYYTKEMVAD